MNFSTTKGSPCLNTSRNYDLSSSHLLIFDGSCGPIFFSLSVFPCILCIGKTIRFLVEGDLSRHTRRTTNHHHPTQVSCLNVLDLLTPTLDAGRRKYPSTLFFHRVMPPTSTSRRPTYYTIQFHLLISRFSRTDSILYFVQVPITDFEIYELANISKSLPTINLTTFNRNYLFTV